MHIERRAQKTKAKGLLRTQLARAARPETVKGRVCGEMCTTRCSRCGSSTCQCMCAPRCPQAPYALSSEGSRYPIEPGVVGLVFEMKRLGVFTPCWSCEGHPQPDGTPHKLPQVWFYSDSLLHVRLLAAGVSKLKRDGRLSTPWQVAVTYSDPENPETTFALEPVGAATLRRPSRLCKRIWPR